MKKMFALLISTILLLGLFSSSVMASTTFTVETPVAMTLVSEENGNYEYKVTANVTVSEGNTQVSILMFGNRDNSAFVEGDNVLKLTVGEIASDFNIYYLDEKTASKEGEVSFVFNVVLPSPAKTDAYYIRIGATDANSATDLDLEDLEINSQIVAVTLTSAKTEYDHSENALLNVMAENVFGNSVPANIEYTVTQNGETINDTVISDGVMSCFGLWGSYNITATASPINGGTSVNSNSLTISVTKDVLLGDANTDGKISVKDVVVILKYISQTQGLQGPGLFAADVNNDGTIDLSDAVRILKFVSRNILSL